MTAQISDQIWYREKQYSIVVASGEGMFKAEEHGLHPVSYSTGCWIGYYCHYEVIDGALRLKRLHIGLSGVERDAADRGEGPILFGLRPTYRESAGYYVYDDFPEPVPFTGSLTLGADFIWDMYVHMGYHPPHKFREVIDLVFKDGRLVQETDRSEEMARLREMMAGSSGTSMMGLGQPPGVVPPDK
jgi:hypothetical protein